MYGATYQPARASDDPGRPGALLGGIAGVFITIVACLVETAFEVLIFQSVAGSKLLQEGDTQGALASQLRGYLVVTIVLNALVALGLGGGTALTLRAGNNLGRILTWSFGGLCALVRLCCLSGVGFFGWVSSMVSSTSEKINGDSSLGELAPGWQVWGAVAANTLALIAITVAMILLALRPVNLYFRAARGTGPGGLPPGPPPPGYGYPPGPPAGPPYGGWRY